jgi:D-sedoheptulose 7-phosphate isomerase
MKEMIEAELNSHKEAIEEVIASLRPIIEIACTLCVKVIKNGKRIFFFGNGGSAADAQHLAAELSGRYKKERRGLPGIALTTDTSAITAISNDYEYDYIFERQVEALAEANDLLIGISSTGNSSNIIRAFKAGRNIGCQTLGLSGKGGGKMNDKCDLNIIVPSDSTARVQEMHILIGHILCQAIDDAFGALS